MKLDVLADPVTAYATDVIKGKVPAGRLVRLACERHINDLKTGGDRGLVFDLNKVHRVIKFFSRLRHSKGEWAGQPVTLEPWQIFVVGCVFGWLREDGLRRFSHIYEAVPRKNGKSTKLAGVGLYLFAADDEPGAEIYSAATKRDQAKIIFKEAVRMVQGCGLKRHVNVLTNNLNVPGTASLFEPLAAEAKTADGLNVHGALVDEVHAHPDGDMIEILDTAIGSRRQPIVWEITTAGSDPHSICYQHHDYSVKVLEGTLLDDTWFCFIAMADEGDDWTDPKTWAKANPNYGVSVKPDTLKEKCDRAQSIVSNQNSFKRLHLNLWTEQHTRWIEMEAWNACGERIDPASLQGRECYGGLDLSSTIDVAALVWCFPPIEEGEPYKFLGRFFVPGDNIEARVKRDRVPYDQWRDEGYVTATEGNVVDYSFIEKAAMEDAAQFIVKELAYDRFNATQLVTNLMAEGMTMVPFGQGFVSMSAPTKELEKLVLSKLLAHGGNPVLRWMISNVAIKEDAAGNQKPAKDKSVEKIDGVVAMIMALGRATINKKEPKSYLEAGELVVL